MSYTPTNWVDGETPVNAENLNKLEQGVADIHTAKENGELDGTPGKSAYRYAQDGGYTGTEEEFAKKLASESSAIHIGTEAPIDENVTLWLDTDEEAPSGGGGVSSWNDLTDRPFYSEYEISTVLDETSPAFDEDDGSFLVTDALSVVTGNEYTVNWNGTEYTCVCGETDIDGALFQHLGNTGAVGMGDDTGEPFVMMIPPDEIVAEVGVYAQIMPLDGSTELTISITGMTEIVTMIPDKYIDPFVFYVDVYPNGDYAYTTGVTYGQVKKALNRGALIVARMFHSADYATSVSFCNLYLVMQYLNGQYEPTELRFAIDDVSGNTLRFHIDITDELPSDDAEYTVTST